nr:NADH dehydrogenase subunit 4L [Austromenopon atrofulvum]
MHAPYYEEENTKSMTLEVTSTSSQMVSSFYLLLIVVTLIKLLMEKSILLSIVTVEASMTLMFSLICQCLFKEWFFWSPVFVMFLSFLVCESVMALGVFISISRQSRGQVPSLVLSKF